MLGKNKKEERILLISTKGRYALRVMVDIAENCGDGYLSLKDIAGRQEISMKYLEMIIGSLAKENLLLSRRGKTGGYMLSKPAKDYTVYEILAAAEDGITPTACPSLEGEICEREDSCTTFPLWKKLNTVIEDYLKNVSLKDLVNGTV